LALGLPRSRRSGWNPGCEVADAGYTMTEKNEFLVLSSIQQPASRILYLQFLSRIRNVAS
jgi:hypothetical protein